MTTPFDYSDPIEFLKAFYEEKRQANPRFSMRAWAKKLGFKNSSTLWKIIAGNMELGPQSARTLRDQLELSIEEKRFFDFLVIARMMETADLELIEIVRKAYRTKENV